MAAGGRLARLADREGAPFAALAGAIVTVVLSVIPFSPVVGGAVASIRYDRGYLAGFGVGILAGVVAALPLAALVVPAVWLVARLGFVAPSSPAFGVFLAILGGLFVAYTVGGSAFGGVVGVAVERHTGWEVDGDRWL